MTLPALRTRVDPWLFAVPAGVLLAGIVSWLIDWRLGVDSAVYRSGALALLHGEPLYDAMSLSAEPPWARLPFTYPPTAALLFVPLTLFPTQVSWGLLGAASVLGMALVIWICVRALPRRPSWLTPGKATLVLSVLLLGIEPVWRTLFLGQINLILLALVVVDVLMLRGSRYSGVLTGVAAAVKLTPLIFIPHLWLTGRRADAVRALGTFLVLQGLVFLLIPHDFTRFWGHAVTDPARTGPIYWAGNQSLNGLVLRLTDLAPWSLTVALAIGALLAVPVALVVRRFHLRGDAVAALLVTAFYGLLISPVSWSHHWVWVVPLIVYLLSRLPEPLPEGAARLRALAGLGAVVAVFASCILLIMRNGKGLELRWTPVEFVIGSAYLLVPAVAAGFVLVRMGKLR
ncbi:MAG TPA: glycosyltransferase 87 family protein [Actinophytocola sp.]|uniref:glycosyltransferase 87 family protein n=1 Tax=Actinophytocola sp. TaxID=1872138 RepID=UPI002DDD6805|nr:glycosyltransferase 87 family protein [Actinophytocola sp.]HEV2784673.1 glycosyltransferase 87 family protein [Actinophytocola sp.]